MTSLKSYKESRYKNLISLLQESKLYDEVREAKENIERKIIKDPESIIIAEKDGELVGCVFVSEDGRNGFIRRLCVKKEFRKQGIGSMLMDKAEELIKSRGIKESSLFVSIENEELKDRYKKRNYKQTNDYSFMFKKLG